MLALFGQGLLCALCWPGVTSTYSAQLSGPLIVNRKRTEENNHTLSREMKLNIPADIPVHTTFWPTGFLRYFGDNNTISFIINANSMRI